MTTPVTWIMFACGLLTGSFLNVCIYRIPEHEFWKNPRSFCRACGEVIPFYLNVPIFSFLMLRGKARCCGARLSWQYPLVELFTGGLFAVVYWSFPFLAQMGGQTAIDPAEMIRFFHALVFCCAMLVCAVIDLRLMIIPDVITIPMVLLTPVVVFFHPDLDWQSALIGVAVGAFSLYAIAWAYWLVRREVGLGMGDVKLLAAVGGWLGYQAVMPTVFIGSISGALIGITAILCVKRLTLKSALPFGPFLAAGAVVHLLFGHHVREWLFMIQQ